MEQKLINIFNSLIVKFSSNSNDVTRVTTEDGASLALKHYRPEPDAPFNTGGQPVLLMPGAIASYYEFDVRTPEGKRCRLALPDNLPGWAEGDVFVKRDPMKLYSLSYYLYSRGHDVWMVNFRGQGRGAEKSFGGNEADVDHFGLYDIKSAVMKVRELTGKKPVYIGHSLGGIMGLIYFQGARYVPGEDCAVESDPRLAEQRNAGDGAQSVKGFVNVDGPCVPYLFGNTRLPVFTRFIWYLTVLPIYIHLKAVTRFLPRGTGRWAIKGFSALWNIRDRLPVGLERAISIIFMVNPDNIDPEVLEHVVRTTVDTIASPAGWQLIDATLCGKLRSSYRRSSGSLKYEDVPPEEGSEGIYSYSDNMDLITVPSLFLADATEDITVPIETENSFKAKTRHPLDEFHVMPHTAHIDLVFGLRAPYETYPTIGAWIDKLEAE